MPVRGRGHICVLANVGGRTKRFKVENVLRVPELRTNLLSLGKITDRGYRVTFDNVKAEVTNKENQTILTAYRKDGLYYLREVTSDPSFEVNFARNIKSVDSVEMWHRKMGHLNVHDLVKCHKDKSVCGMNLKDSMDTFTCEICARGKMTRTPFPTNEPRNSEKLQIIHSDVCGPMRVESIGKARYIVTFVDDYSRWCEIRLLKRKDEVLTAFKDFKAMAERLHGRKIIFLQTDN